MSAYRGVAQEGGAVRLVEEAHEAGVTLGRCHSCRGAFAPHEHLVAIENWARRTKKQKPSATDAMRRGYDPPTETIACPACASETTRREWGIGTMVFVDVCIECRGVWLDGGELETLVS